MTDIGELLEKIAQNRNCTVSPIRGQAKIDDGLVLPSDENFFYSRCGGVKLFVNQPYSIEIVSPKNFVRANPVILGEEMFDDISNNWYIIGKSGNTQFITIDLSKEKSGSCYDSFWDIYGVPGQMPTISQSFTSFLNQMYFSEGKSLYWLESGFSNLGDAYD